MFDLHSLSTAMTLLKIVVGLCMLAELPIFLFKLLTGRYRFAKDEGRDQSTARGLMPEPEWTAAAFEEVERSRQSQRGDALTPMSRIAAPPIPRVRSS
jgi:hypothetical protein